MSEVSSFIGGGNRPTTSEFRGNAPLQERPVLIPPPTSTNDNPSPRIPKPPFRWPRFKVDPRKAMRAAIIAGAALWLAPQIVPAICHMQASALYDQGKYVQAVGYDAAGLRWAVTPGAKANLLMWRGYDYLFSDQDAPALADFTASVKLDPSVPKSTANIYWMAQPPNAFKGLFWANFESKQYGTALAECNRMIAIAPDDAENYAIRAKCLRGLGQFGAAEQQFNYALGHNPQMLFAYYHLADMQQKNLHNPQAALATMQRAVRFNSDNADAWGMLGWQQYVSGDSVGALKTDERSLAMSDASSQDYVRCNMALIYAAQGNWPMALPLYQAAVAGNNAPELQGGLKDIEDALIKQPDSSALQQARALISRTLAARRLSAKSDDES